MSFMHPNALHDDREGVRFTMKHGELTLNVLVSRHALEDIEPLKGGDTRLQRFTEYREQFEQMAGAKYDRGLVEQDGTVCIRGRDLPGRGY